MCIHICMRLTKEHHIRNSNEKTLCGPGYCFVNTVKFSLQSDRNTQFRTCIILVIFSCFRNTTDEIVSNNKKLPILRYNIQGGVKVRHSVGFQT